MTKTFRSGKAYVNQENIFKGPQSFRHDVENVNYAEFDERGTLHLHKVC